MVIERPYASTLDNLWTLWNAANMLKVGGELIIDSPYNESFPSYEFASEEFFTLIPLHGNDESKKQYNIFCKHYNNRDNGRYDTEEKFIQTGETLYGASGGTFNPENIKTKLKRFKIQPKRVWFPQGNLDEMGEFLAGAYFTDIVTVGQAYQPYAGRETSLLSVTKTKDTNTILAKWRAAISRRPQKK